MTAATAGGSDSHRTALSVRPKFTDLFFRVLPSVLATEGRTMGQSIYIDMSPDEVIERMTKTQNDWFATK